MRPRPPVPSVQDFLQAPFLESTSASSLRDQFAEQSRNRKSSPCRPPMPGYSRVSCRDGWRHFGEETPHPRQSAWSIQWNLQTTGDQKKKKPRAFQIEYPSELHVSLLRCAWKYISVKKKLCVFLVKQKLLLYHKGGEESIQKRDESRRRKRDEGTRKRRAERHE